MKTKGEILRTIEYVILIVVAAIALLPLFWLFVSSFKTDADVIRFKNAKNETVDALEVRTDDTIYLVKVSTRLADTMENFDEDDDFMNNEEDDMSVSNLDIPDDSSLDDE